MDIINLFLISSLTTVLITNKINKVLFGLHAFFAFKMFFNYRKCSFAYMECTLRNVKRNEGILNKIMDPIIDEGHTMTGVIVYVTLLVLYIIKSTMV
jgi:hypothetical protein